MPVWLYSQAPLGEITSYTVLDSRDTLVHNRLHGDYWFNVTGGARFGLNFGDLKLPLIIGDEGNPFNTILEYKSGTNYGFNAGFSAEYLPKEKMWGYGLNLKFFDVTRYNATSEPFLDSIGSEYDFEGTLFNFLIQPFARYNFEVEGLHAFGGMNFLLNYNYEAYHNYSFFASEFIDKKEKVELEKVNVAFGAFAGIGYEFVDLDINNSIRMKISPHASLNFLTSQFADNESSWYNLYPEVGISFKFGPDEVTYDTMYFDPTFVPAPKVALNVRSESGISFPGFTRAETLPAQELKLVYNPRIFGEIKEELALKEVEKPREEVAGRPREVVAFVPNITRNFSFTTSSSVELDQQTKEYLKRVAEEMKENPNYELRVIGHSDNRGTLAQNTERSRKRAEAVRDQLVQDGIPFDRILIRYKGSLDPIAPNNTPEGRQKNRRVEIVVVPK